jgi:hypothetical protein
VRRRPHLDVWLGTAAVVAAVAGLWAQPQSHPSREEGQDSIAVDAVPVPLNPRHPSRVRIGNFTFAGGLKLTSAQTTRLHGLSDLLVTESGQVTAVGDEGVLLRAQLVLDAMDRLVGLTDVRLALLAGEDGKPLRTKEESDAEGLARLASGDLLVSFEERHRVWLYPADAGPPRPVVAPNVTFPTNAGMEALSADPAAGPDAFIVGAEETGQTWNCRVSAPSCTTRMSIAKPREFGLVAMQRLSGMRTAYLLRAFDARRGNRITLKIYDGRRAIDRMDMARPMTIDNFEGLAAVPRADGRVRFYLLSDDNARATQQTLLFAFDWQPRR